MCYDLPLINWKPVWEGTNASLIFVSDDEDDEDEDDEKDDEFVLFSSFSTSSTTILSSSSKPASSNFVSNCPFLFGIKKLKNMDWESC